MGAVDKNNQIARLNKTRRHYRWLRRLFMKFLVWTAYNAYIIMDSYRPHSCAGHHFRTFHMFVDELCLQVVGDYHTAVHRREARAHPKFHHVAGRGRQRARAPGDGEFHLHQSLRPRLPAWPPLITLDPALSPLSLAVSFVCYIYVCYIYIYVL